MSHSEHQSQEQLHSQSVSTSHGQEAHHEANRIGAKEVALIGAGATGAVAAGMIYLVKNIAEKTFGIFGGGHDNHGHGHSGKDLLDVGEFMAAFVPTGGGGAGKSSHGGGHH